MTALRETVGASLHADPMNDDLATVIPFPAPSEQVERPQPPPDSPAVTRYWARLAELTAERRRLVTDAS